MEEKKNINAKIILSVILAIVTIIAIIEGIVIITINSKDNKGLTSESCLGTWEIVDDEERFLQIITLYQGGTGHYIDKDGGEGSITWEIADNILNITFSTAYPQGFTINENEMTRVDGKVTYRRQ